MHVTVHFGSSFVLRALVNLTKNHSYLMKVDALAARSCLYLMSIEELVECSININCELLDMLHVFINKVPLDINYGTFQVSGNRHFQVK